MWNKAMCDVGGTSDVVGLLGDVIINWWGFLEGVSTSDVHTSDIHVGCSHL